MAWIRGDGGRVARVGRCRHAVRAGRAPGAERAAQGGRPCTPGARASAHPGAIPGSRSSPAGRPWRWGGHRAGRGASARCRRSLRRYDHWTKRRPPAVVGQLLDHDRLEVDHHEGLTRRHQPPRREPTAGRRNVRRRRRHLVPLRYDLSARCPADEEAEPVTRRVVADDHQTAAGEHDREPRAIRRPEEFLDAGGIEHGSGTRSTTRSSAADEADGAGLHVAATKTSATSPAARDRCRG